MLLLGVGGRIGWFRRVTPYNGTDVYDSFLALRASIGL
jgi:hypothetical protein